MAKMKGEKMKLVEISSEKIAGNEMKAVKSD
jgi:hypothetical protein